MEIYSSNHSYSKSTACLYSFFSQHLCDLLLQAAQRQPLVAWNEKLFLRTHPSVKTGWGGGHMGHHGSIQGFQLQCLPGMMPLKGHQYVR